MDDAQIILEIKQEQSVMQDDIKELKTQAIEVDKTIINHWKDLQKKLSGAMETPDTNSVNDKE